MVKTPATSRPKAKAKAARPAKKPATTPPKTPPKTQQDDIEAIAVEGATPETRQDTPPQSEPVQAAPEPSKPAQSKPVQSKPAQSKPVPSAQAHSEPVVDAAAEPPADAPADAPANAAPESGSTELASASPPEAGTADATADTTGPEPLLSEEPPAPQPAAEPPRAEGHAPPPRRGSWVPLVVGGVLAGAIGFGAAYLVQQQGLADLTSRTALLADEVATQKADIAALNDQLAALPPPADLGPLEHKMQTLGSDTSAQIDALQQDVAGKFDALDARVVTLEKIPAGDGTLADAAVAAYEKELQALKDEVAAQKTSLEQVAANAQAQLQEAHQQAAAVQADAAAAAKQAAASAALAQVQAALDSGTPFAAVLSDLGQNIDQPIPDALSAVANGGVPALASLQAAFPPLAREALAAARHAGVSGEGGGAFLGFLRSQLNIRSVTPQQGNDTDSVLSRVQADLGAGHLTDALAEIDTLPDVAKAALAGWTAKAKARAAALAAAGAIATSLNAN